MNFDMTEHIQTSLKAFQLPRYQEIPDIGLYLEQTSKYVSECVAPLMKEDMTGSMISNYVKRGVLSSPIKKQYSREQIASLICIAIVKRVLPLEDIKLLFRIQQRSYKAQKAYDSFCSELNSALKYVSEYKQPLDTVAAEDTRDRFMLRSILTAAAHSLYLEKIFSELHKAENQSAT